MPVHQSLHARNLHASALSLDVTDPSAIRQAMESIANTYGRLDILVNNAYGLSPVDDGAQNFRQAYEVSVVAAQQIINAALPLLRAAAHRGNASIINIASMYGMVSPDLRIYTDAPPNPSYYGASKAALIQLSRYLACEFAPQGIRVNSISPGPFPSFSSRENHPELMKALCAKAPMGRIGDPEELGGAVVFLASKAASYVTGINLPVDGGWTAW